MTDNSFITCRDCDGDYTTLKKINKLKLVRKMMESKRFHIEDNGIYDKSRSKTLNWWELCNTLNTLELLADKNIDKLDYILKLEHEIEELKFEVSQYESLFEYMKRMRDEMIGIPLSDDVE